MRCLAGVTMVLVVLAALPRGASAQAGEEGTASGPNAQEAVSEPAPEEPALKPALDAAGVAIGPSPPRTVDGYTLEEMELRVKRAKIGIGASALSLAVFGVAPSPPRTPGGYTLEEAELRVKGARVGVIMSVIPLVVGGILLGVPPVPMSPETVLGGGRSNRGVGAWSHGAAGRDGGSGPGGRPPSA